MSNDQQNAKLLVADFKHRLTMKKSVLVIVGKPRQRVKITARYGILFTQVLPVRRKKR